MLEVIPLADSFPQILSALRREKKVNQRTAAAELGISQALLSHYENGLREPGLAFLDAACRYYGVSADYLLGRTGIRAPFPARATGRSDLTEHGNLAVQSLLALLNGMQTADRAFRSDMFGLLEVQFYSLLRSYDTESTYTIPEDAVQPLCAAAASLLRARLQLEKSDSGTVNLQLPPKLLRLAEDRLQDLQAEWH